MKYKYKQKITKQEISSFVQNISEYKDEELIAIVEKICLYVLSEYEKLSEDDIVEFQKILEQVRFNNHLNDGLDSSLLEFSSIDDGSGITIDHFRDSFFEYLHKQNKTDMYFEKN